MSVTTAAALRISELEAEAAMLQKYIGLQDRLLDERDATIEQLEWRPSLLPAESMALTVASAQIRRGDNPPINITTVLVMALERLTGATHES